MAQRPRPDESLPGGRKPQARGRGLVLSFCALMLGGAAAPEPAPQTAPFRGGQVAFVEIDKAAPVVVFENGLGGDLGEWRKVLPEVARTNTVFAYDRPGVGRSTPTDRPRDAAGIVDDLRSLLRERRLAPPYVLVGHSMGGLDLQLFARRYPDEVVGLVLVDSTHPRSFSGPGAMENRGALSRAALAVGLSASAKAEFNALPASAEEVLSAPAVPTQKVVVAIVAPDASHSAMAAYDNAMRSDFVNLYPGAKLVEVSGGHKVPQTHPEVVVQAIREVLDKAGR